MDKIPTVLVGYTRSATKSIARLIFKLGTYSVHEAMPRPGDIGPYDFFNPPRYILEFLKKKTFYDFEANWEYAYWMYTIQKELGYNILIMTRNPVYACNSMVKHSKVIHRRQYSVDLCARKYDEIYSSMIEQVLYMNPRPKYLKFEKYVKGGYNYQLVQNFATSDFGNYETIDKHLARKVNHHGPYDLQNTPKVRNINSSLEKCQRMRRILENLCEEF